MTELFTEPELREMRKRLAELKPAVFFDRYIDQRPDRTVVAAHPADSRSVIFRKEAGR